MNKNNFIEIAHRYLISVSKVSGFSVVDLIREIQLADGDFCLIETGESRCDQMEFSWNKAAVNPAALASAAHSQSPRWLA